jgi:hypothetical protein
LKGKGAFENSFPDKEHPEDGNSATPNGKSSNVDGVNEVGKKAEIKPEHRAALCNILIKQLDTVSLVF